MAMHLGRLTRTAALGCFLSAALATHNVRGTGECVRPGRCEVCTRGPRHANVSRHLPLAMQNHSPARRSHRHRFHRPQPPPATYSRVSKATPRQQWNFAGACRGTQEGRGSALHNNFQGPLTTRAAARWILWSHVNPDGGAGARRMDLARSGPQGKLSRRGALRWRPARHEHARALPWTARKFFRVRSRGAPPSRRLSWLKPSGCGRRSPRQEEDGLRDRCAEHRSDREQPQAAV